MRGSDELALDLQKPFARVDALQLGLQRRLRNGLSGLQNHASVLNAHAFRAPLQAVARYTANDNQLGKDLRNILLGGMSFRGLIQSVIDRIEVELAALARGESLYRSHGMKALNQSANTHTK